MWPADDSGRRIDFRRPVARTTGTVWLSADNRYAALDAIAARVLDEVQACPGLSLSELLTALPPSQRADAARAVRALEGSNVLVTWGPEGLPLRRRLVVALIVANVAAQITLLLAPRPFLRRIVTTRGPAAAETSSWCGVTGEELIGAARLAAAFPGVNARCLPTACAIWMVLRFRGYPAKLRIGAVDAPFAAHAWVELAGNRLDPAPVAFPGEAFEVDDRH